MGNREDFLKSINVSNNNNKSKIEGAKTFEKRFKRGIAVGLSMIALAAQLTACGTRKNVETETRKPDRTEEITVIDDSDKETEIETDYKEPTIEIEKVIATKEQALADLKEKFIEGYNEKHQTDLKVEDIKVSIQGLSQNLIFTVDKYEGYERVERFYSTVGSNVEKTRSAFIEQGYAALTLPVEYDVIVQIINNKDGKALLTYMPSLRQTLESGNGVAQGKKTQRPDTVEELGLNDEMFKYIRDAYMEKNPDKYVELYASASARAEKAKEDKQAEETQIIDNDEER